MNMVTQVQLTYQRYNNSFAVRGHCRGCKYIRDGGPQHQLYS